MAAIIESVFTPGQQLYFTLHDLNGLIWNGTTFESFTGANWALYANTITEQANTGYYRGTMPAAIPGGKYSFVVYRGSPPTVGDSPVDRGFMDWNGTIENILNAITAKLPAGTISGFDPTSQNVNLNNNQSGVTIGTVNNLGAGAAASVKTQVDASLGTDAMPELSAVPAATPSLKSAIMFLLMAFRNKRTSTATTISVYNSSGAAITSAPQSDNGTTYDKENFT
jgi:hypothetical protein